LALSLGPPLAAAAPFGAGDALFMGPASQQHYRDYHASWVLWGDQHGAAQLQEAHAAGVKLAPSFWCLTAGPERLHDDPALAEAVCRDIEGQPIEVPWQADHSYQGTPTWFGCTNAPAFQALLEQRADEVAALGPDGVQVDDPLGTLNPVEAGTGCYCRHCAIAFRAWLQAHDSPQLRSEAGVGDWTGFDYPALVRRVATTRAQTQAHAPRIPLHRAYVRFQVEARVAGLKALRDRVRARTRPDLPFSLNAYFDHPGGPFVALLPLTTHQVAEVVHYANFGTQRLWEAAQAYRQADALGCPLAATASGEDYAWVKAHDAVDLVKVWIGLGFAMGQRLMVPHPERQWCHTGLLGTHWYAAPVAPFAPLYRFAQAHDALLEGFQAVGPAAVGSAAGLDLLDADARQALAQRLQAVDGPWMAGDHVWVLPRRHPDGRLVVHLLNTQYSVALNLLAPVVDQPVSLAADLWPPHSRHALLHRPDGPDLRLPVQRAGGSVRFTVTGFDAWAIAEAAD
jgi:hypothetical protein